MTTIESPSEDLLGFEALLSTEEREWQLRARDVAQQVILPSIDEDFELARFRAEVVPQLGVEGFLGAHISGYGCPGKSATVYGLVCHEFEAVDSAWRTFVSVQGSLAMSAIYKYGSEDQKTTYLPRMANGEVIGCFGLTEPHGGSDPASMKTFARREGDEWVLSGSKRWIGLASVAQIAVIWAGTDEGVRGFIVPTDSPGFTATPIEHKLSMRASIQCDIALSDVRLPATAQLPLAKGLSGPFGCLNEARYGIVWGVMGAARSALDAATLRSRSRIVFGEPIGARQLVQKRLADAFVEYEKGMLLSLHLGRLKDAGRLTPDQISVGKLNNVREAIKIVSSMRSLLGGDGITAEFPVMRHMANLESVRTYEGTDEVHELVIGRAITHEAAFR